MQNPLEKKKLVPILYKTPPGQISQEFWPKSNDGVCALKKLMPHKYS